MKADFLVIGVDPRGVILSYFHINRWMTFEWFIEVIRVVGFDVNVAGRVNNTVVQ